MQVLLLPIQETIIEMINSIDIVDDGGNGIFGSRDELVLAKFDTNVHEDDSTTLSLVALNQMVMGSRTKHWCIKFHFFWSHINDKCKNISYLKVDTKEQ